MLYSTSLPDKGWELIQPILESYGISDKGRKHPPRSIIDAIFYVNDNGNKWRNLPNDFPPWKTVYHYFSKWSHSEMWSRISLVLVESVRFSQGREESPSLVSIDSQSQSGEPGIQGRGLDGNKKQNGRKRHIAVDVNGLIVDCYCSPANESDTRGGRILAEDLNDTETFDRLKKILGDNAYIGIARASPKSSELHCSGGQILRQRAGFTAFPLAQDTRLDPKSSFSANL